jgi:type IV secretion system protein VirB6
MQDIMTMAGGWLSWLLPNVQLDQAAQWAFFKIIFGFLDGEILAFQDNLLGGTLKWVGGIALVLLTIWIFWQGFQILTGRSRDSLMALVASSLRSVLIVSVATSMAFGSSDLYGTFTDGMQREVTEIVTGEADTLPADMIDDSLDVMQLTMVGIDGLAAGNQMLKSDKDRALMLTGVGVAGPAIIGGAMLLLYKIAMALFVGLGPLFILSLLFEQTKQLFSKWLYYGIATMFTLAVLSFMVVVAMKMVVAVAGAFVTQYGLAMALGVAPQGVNSMALQQGGLGMILTVLLVMTPPMAGAFFQGTLGQFSSYNQFASGSAPPGAAGPGSGPSGRYVPQQPIEGGRSLNARHSPVLDMSNNNPATNPYLGSAAAQTDVTKPASYMPPRG